MRKTKNIIQILMLILLVVVFSGCGQQKKAEVADSDDWRDAQVMIHGTRLKDLGNMTVADLEKLGFKKTIYNSEVDAGQKDMVSLEAKTGSEGLYDFRVINKTGKKASADECNIESVYMRIPDEKDEFKVAKDISLANGVTVGMTSDEIRKIMGDPDNEKIKEDKVDTYKTWTYHTNSPEKDIIMIFEKDTDVMNMLIVRY